MQPAKRLVSSWSKPRRHIAELTPDEQTGVRRALDALRVRFGSDVALAKRMGCSSAIVGKSRRARAPSVALALLASRAAGVPISDVLAGRFPKAGECPLCGHVKRAPKATRSDG